MKYNIEIMGRDEIIYLDKLNKILDECIIISINDSGYTTELKSNKIRDILTLEFDDIERSRAGLKAMSDNDGFRIKQFIDKYKMVNNIIIHCTAGISRSAGVACGIALYLNKTDEYIWSSKRYLPNKRCYYITSKSFGINISKERYKHKKSLNERDNEKIKKYLKRGYITINELLEGFN